MKKYLLSLLFVLLPTVLMAQAAGETIKRQNKENVAKKQNPRQQKSKPSQSAKPAKVSTDNSQPSVMTEPQMTSAEMLQKGYDYRRGINGMTKSDEDAFYWFKKAAEAGSSQAKFEVFSCYKYGTGCTMDKTKAVMYLKQSAEDGCADAQFWLGLHFQLGNNCGDSRENLLGRDEEQSFFWYKKAALQNNPLACHSVGIAYKEGRGCTQNTNQAKFWFQKAVELGFERAKSELENLK